MTVFNDQRGAYHKTMALLYVWKNTGFGFPAAGFLQPISLIAPSPLQSIIWWGWPRNRGHQAALLMRQRYSDITKRRVHAKVMYWDITKWKGYTDQSHLLLLTQVSDPRGPVLVFIENTSTIHTANVAAGKGPAAAALPLSHQSRLTKRINPQLINTNCNTLSQKIPIFNKLKQHILADEHRMES